MTRVCLVGDPAVNLQYELLSRETSREALATYDLERPFENALAVRTVSLGAAVSLLNDLQWYLTRFVDEALVREPSVSDEEWLSRPLAEALRNGDLEPAETAEYYKLYGLERTDDDPDRDEDDAADESAGTDEESETDDEGDDASRVATPDYRLVEPLYVRPTDGDLPDYDLREVEETLAVRLTESEYGP